MKELGYGDDYKYAHDYDNNLHRSFYPMKLAIPHSTNRELTAGKMRIETYCASAGMGNTGIKSL
jgi:replication-associated recombination protein RarA